MPATMTTVNNILKEIYQPQIRDQLQNEVIGLKRIERTSDGVTNEVGGKYVTFPIRVSRNSGIGYRNENEILPNPGQQGYRSVRIGLKYGYGSVQLTGQTLKLAESNKQAFASAMSTEMDGLKRDLVKDQARIFYGDGTGTLAVANATYTGTNIFLTSNTQYIEVGYTIDILTSAGATRSVTSRNVTAVVANTSVTFDGAAIGTGASGDIIVRGSTRAGTAANNYGKEPNGLGSIVSATGTLFNVDPTVDPIWKAYVDANGGTNRALSEGLMIKTTDEIRRNGGRTSVIFTSLGVRRAYFNLLSQQRRYTDTKTFDGGIQGLAFNNDREIPVVADVDAPPNKMWFLQEDVFKVYRESDWSWMDEDGSIWQRVIGYDAFGAELVQYWELGIDVRNNNGLLSDVTEG